MNLEGLIDELVDMGRHDWVGIWELPMLARTMGGASRVEDVRAVCLTLLSEVLSRGLFEVGDVTNSGFATWKMSCADAVALVETEWLALPRDPSVGDIGWISLTRAGEAWPNQPDERGDA
jgi:hypothetical protein